MCRCTADCGWITGHTYLTYGPLLNGATCVIYEGVPAYPKPDRIWQIVEKYKVAPLSVTFVRAALSKLPAAPSHFAVTFRKTGLFTKPQTSQHFPPSDGRL